MDRNQRDPNTNSRDETRRAEVGQDELGRTAGPQQATGVPSKNDIGVGENYEEHAHHQKADRADTSDE